MTARVPSIESVGKKYGRVTVLRITRMIPRNPSKSNPYGGTTAEVEYECECGTRKCALLQNIKQGQVASCGCLRKYKIGEVVGRFTIIQETENGDRIGVRCADCGTEKEISVHNLVSQSTAKCMCLPKYKSQHKRSGSWQVTIKHQYIGFYKTEKEADQAIASHMRSMQRGSL